MLEEFSIPEWVKEGVSFDVVYGNEFDTLWHIRGIVDGHAVCRCWLRHKNRWHYEIKDWAFFSAARQYVKPRNNSKLKVQEHAG